MNDNVSIIQEYYMENEIEEIRKINTRRKLAEQLLCAAKKGETDTLELLLKNGADEQAIKDVLLLFAVSHQRKDEVKLLLKAGADPHVVDILDT